tara:strand:+ start:1512 stop:1634 length:123 start_codon:yes stop_codon:yes gene_type:complete
MDNDLAGLGIHSASLNGVVNPLTIGGYEYVAWSAIDNLPS